jgi:hypothetical protein
MLFWHQQFEVAMGVERPKMDPAAELRSLARQFQMCTIAVARIDT